MSRTHRRLVRERRSFNLMRRAWKRFGAPYPYPHWTSRRRISARTIRLMRWLSTPIARSIYIPLHGDRSVPTQTLHRG